MAELTSRLDPVPELTLQLDLVPDERVTLTCPSCSYPMRKPRSFVLEHPLEVCGCARCGLPCRIPELEGAV